MSTPVPEVGAARAQQNSVENDQLFQYPLTNFDQSSLTPSQQAPTTEAPPQNHPAMAPSFSNISPILPHDEDCTALETQKSPWSPGTFQPTDVETSLEVIQEDPRPLESPGISIDVTRKHFGPSSSIGKGSARVPSFSRGPSFGRSPHSSTPSTPHSRSRSSTPSPIPFGRVPSFKAGKAFLAKSLQRFASFGDINLGRDAPNWGPLPGYEAVELHLDRLSGRQQLLANGRLGRLYRAHVGEEEVCLKIVKCDTPQEGDDASRADEKKLACVRRELLREVDSLAKIDHPRIVKLVGVAERKENVHSHMWCIAMEYMPGGTLRDALRKRKGDPLPLPTLLSLALDIAQAMAYLHSKGIIHRDLKSPNVLLDATKLVAKVADFGTSREIHPEVEMTSETGTFRWMAPEMIRGDAYESKVDVFSFGVILWELLTLEFPWQDSSCMQVAFAVAQKGERPSFPPGLPPVLVALTKKCWDGDPKVRPSFEDLIRFLRSAQEALSSDPTLLTLTTPPSPQPTNSTSNVNQRRNTKARSAPSSYFHHLDSHSHSHSLSSSFRTTSSETSGSTGTIEEASNSLATGSGRKKLLSILLHRMSKAGHSTQQQEREPQGNRIIPKSMSLQEEHPPATDRVPAHSSPQRRRRQSHSAPLGRTRRRFPKLSSLVARGQEDAASVDVSKKEEGGMSLSRTDPSTIAHHSFASPLSHTEPEEVKGVAGKPPQNRSFGHSLSLGRATKRLPRASGTAVQEQGVRNLACGSIDDARGVNIRAAFPRAPSEAAY